MASISTTIGVHGGAGGHPPCMAPRCTFSFVAVSNCRRPHCLVSPPPSAHVSAKVKLDAEKELRESLQESYLAYMSR